MIKKIDHTHVYVKDFKRALEFYTKTMGFPIVGTPIDESVKLRFLKVGPDVLEVLQEDPINFPKKCQCILLVDDIEKEVAALKKKGLETSEIGEAEMKETGKHKYGFAKTVEGDWIELIERRK